ncbi:hypothetical protein N7462_004282 [Penicillium macrosclerotiorum]|uniref:uncharacterized protein n=1 Tax=Penicillium macrosclerotiorum TaxID=303699 RepID=UPI00254880AF|nr:uncharacterized protein N7462_004282 [Penicillium macrosclerotiorum]KAJ5689890.1 hypothetical protein N7462_004282 [Penicillium macrosclerotiorum]
MLRPTFPPSSLSSLISPRSTFNPSRLRPRLASSHPPSFAFPRCNRRLYSTEFNPSVHSAPPRSRLRRFAGFASIAVLAFSAGLIYQTQRTVSRLMATPIISDEQTLTAYTPEDEIAQEINERLRTHPEAIRLREDPEFTEARPHLKIPETLRPRSLTAGTLAGPNKIVVPPYVFSERGGKSMVSLMYLGSDICGHPGIVHGGLLATLLDEGLARCCFPALPNKVGVTANLNIDYRAPAMANSYVALRAETVRVEGRKAWVEGRIETLPEEGKEPVVLVEAKALFIEPKQAAALSSLYRGVTE